MISILFVNFFLKILIKIKIAVKKNSFKFQRLDSIDSHFMLKNMLKIVCGEWGGGGGRSTNLDC